MDICLRYGKIILGIELKVWRDRRPDPLTKGLEQLESYLARLGLETGWLVIFVAAGGRSHRRSNQPPIEERTTTEIDQTSSGRMVTVIRA